MTKPLFHNVGDLVEFQGRDSIIVGTIMRQPTGIHYLIKEAAPIEGEVHTIHHSKITKNLTQITNNQNA